MRIELSQTLVLHKLTIDNKPAEGPLGRIVYVPNPQRTPYIVFDAHRDAPVGFGVKVGATKKVYLVQRRAGAVVVKAKLGNVADFPSISAARLAAADMARTIHEGGRNPNAVKRETLAAAKADTLGGALHAYRDYLASRSKKRAKPSTLRVVDATIRHFEDWADKPIGELSSAAILKRWHAGIRSTAEGTTATDRGRTATEQRFRWATAAVRHAMKREAHEALLGGREPRLPANPFDILAFEEVFRTKAELERDFKERGSRNPLGIREGTLGRFLAALWGRRTRNRMGGDYLLLTLLWGARRNESASVQWRDRLTPAAAARCSWVDLDTREVCFYRTKNGNDLFLPIGDGALEILKQRKDDRKAGELYVFPVRSSKKTNSAVHYSDAKSILRYVRVDAGLKVLRTHDLRRTFGRVAEETTSETMVKRLLNHTDPRNPTLRYTDPEWQRVVEVVQKVECALLAAAPTVYNALLPFRTYPRLEDVSIPLRISSQSQSPLA